MQLSHVNQPAKLKASAKSQVHPNTPVPTEGAAAVGVEPTDLWPALPPASGWSAGTSNRLPVVVEGPSMLGPTSQGKQLTQSLSTDRVVHEGTSVPGISGTLLPESPSTATPWRPALGSGDGHLTHGGTLASGSDVHPPP